MTEGKRASAGPRVGSLTWTLQNIEPGCCHLFAVPEDRTNQVFMQYVASGISRTGMSGQYHQTLVLGIELSTRKLIEIVKVARDPLPAVKAPRARRAPKA